MDPARIIRGMQTSEAGGKGGTSRAKGSGGAQALRNGQVVVEGQAVVQRPSCRGTAKLSMNVRAVVETAKLSWGGRMFPQGQV